MANNGIAYALLHLQKYLIHSLNPMCKFIRNFATNNHNSSNNNYG